MSTKIYNAYKFPKKLKNSDVFDILCNISHLAWIKFQLKRRKYENKKSQIDNVIDFIISFHISNDCKSRS